MTWVRVYTLWQNTRNWKHIVFTIDANGKLKFNMEIFFKQELMSRIYETIKLCTKSNSFIPLIFYLNFLYRVFNSRNWISLPIWQFMSCHFGVCFSWPPREPQGKMRQRFPRFGTNTGKQHTRWPHTPIHTHTGAYTLKKLIATRVQHQRRQQPHWPGIFYS